MSLDMEKKKIIELIEAGTIRDLSSFIRCYYNDVKLSINKEELSTKKKTDYDSNVERIQSYKQELYTKHKINELTDDPDLKANRKFNKKEIDDCIMINNDYTIDDKDFNFEYINSKDDDDVISVNILDKEIYFIEDKSLLHKYFEVLEYLKANNYIYLTSKKIGSDDLLSFFKQKIEHEYIPSKKTFYRTKPDSEYMREKELFKSLKGIKSLSFGETLNSRVAFKKNDFEYMDLDYNIELNIELFEEFIKNLSVRICADPMLSDFVKHDFTSIDTRRYKKQQTFTYIAIAVALFSSIVSICLSISNENFWRDNEKREITKNDLEYEELTYINKSLNNIEIILQNDTFREETVNYLSEIKELINNKDVNLNYEELYEIIKQIEEEIENDMNSEP